MLVWGPTSAWGGGQWGVFEGEEGVADLGNGEAHAFGCLDAFI